MLSNADRVMHYAVQNKQDHLSQGILAQLTPPHIKVDMLKSMAFDRGLEFKSKVKRQELIDMLYISMMMPNLTPAQRRRVKANEHPPEAHYQNKRAARARAAIKRKMHWDSSREKQLEAHLAHALANNRRARRMASKGR